MKVNKIFIILLISILIVSLSSVNATNETDIEDNGQISVEPVITDDTVQNYNNQSINANDLTANVNVSGVVSDNLSFCGNAIESGKNYSNTFSFSVYVEENSNNFNDENIGVSLTYDDYMVEISAGSFITISMSNNDFKTTPNISTGTTRKLCGVTLFSTLSDNILVLGFDFLNESSNNTFPDGFMVTKSIFFDWIGGIFNLFKSAEKLLFSFIA